ncbi:MAG: TIGR01777 family oxidoreductase [Verrucomicrobiales bacterium]
MKVGITGASGFLGSALIAQANGRQWSVAAFSRDPDKPIEGADEVRSLGGGEKIDLDGLDALIHLAGEPLVGLWTKEKKRRIRESRVGLTSALVGDIGSLSRSRRPPVLVSASAVGYYGDRGDEWLDEEADVGFGFLAEVCRDWEAAAAKASRLGVRVVTPRLGLVLGKGGLLKRLRPIFRAGLGGPLGKGDQWMSWIHVEDAARVFLECVANDDVTGRVNCAAPNPATNREFTRTYAASLKRKAFLRVPGAALKRLPGGMGRMFLDSQRVAPVVMRAFDYRWLHEDLESALRAIEAET